MARTGFKRMLLGEKMPDKNDPQYKERYEKEVSAGRRFARWTRLDRLAACIQRFAERNRNLFLVMVFSFVAFMFGLTIYRMCNACRYQSQVRSVVEVQDSILHAKRHNSTSTNPIIKEDKR